MTSQEIVKKLDYEDDLIMSEIFNSLIGSDENVKKKAHVEELWNEYDGDVPILHRERAANVPDYKANNKIPNDYRSMIIEQGSTYFMGKPVVVNIDEKLGSNKEKINKLVTNFKRVNSTDDLDMETVLLTSTCGYSGRLMYIDPDGNERLLNIPPWEVIFIYNRTTKELMYALIYYKVEVYLPKSNSYKEVTRIEWYDNQNVYYYLESPKKENAFIPDPDEPVPSKPHGFSYVPVIEFMNNDLRKGDFERVRDEIDAYDRLFSDAQNELEDFRNAYMVFKGVQPDKETMELAKQTGAFGSEDEDFDVKFLIKELSGQFHENHKKTTNDNIYKFSKRVDMNDEKFSGSSQSGEGRKWKLLALENDAVMKERKFTKALRQQYKILSSSSASRAVGFNYLDITFQYTRNLPVDLEYYGRIITQLFGKVPLKTLYSLMPFIDDPEAQIKLLRMENKLNGLDLDNMTEEEITRALNGDNNE